MSCWSQAICSMVLSMVAIGEDLTIEVATTGLYILLSGSSPSCVGVAACGMTAGPTLWNSCACATKASNCAMLKPGYLTDSAWVSPIPAVSGDCPAWSSATSGKELDPMTRSRRMVSPTSWIRASNASLHCSFSLAMSACLCWSLAMLASISASSF